MRIGQRGKFIGHEFYEGCLEGGELFTVYEIVEEFPDEGTILFKAKMDTGEIEYLLTDQVELLTENEDLQTLKILIERYPEQARKFLK